MVCYSFNSKLRPSCICQRPKKRIGSQQDGILKVGRQLSFPFSFEVVPPPTKKTPVTNVYSWPTPDGHKVHIMLEECGFRLGRDWKMVPVNIGAGDQFQPELLAIGPNNKIQALVDPSRPDVNLFPCLNPVPSSFTRNRKSVRCCPKVTGLNSRCCSG